jgi:tetratricopeptide (TPR) repeat protein
MDPMGTITQYFPFIDEETKEVLEKVMTDASDYYDFVHKLGELVLKTDPQIMVVYFAVHHCILALEYPLIDMIREKYDERHLILGPNLFITSAFEGTYEDVKRVHELADAVLATEPEDWIALEMNFMKFEADMINYPTTIYQESTLERILELIDSNPDFGFYEIILNDYQSHRALTDGDSEERFRCTERGIEIAKKYDDRLRIAHLLIWKANILMNQDRKQSRDILEQAYQVVDSSLGLPGFYADILYNLSMLDAIRGEFDSAIRRGLEAVNFRERAGLETGNASYFLALYYNIIGEAESGLEWGCMAEDQLQSRPYLINRAVLNQIWSLILLKRITEAQALIDTIRESIMKSGDEKQLAWLHYVTGAFEIEQGDFSLALSSIEQALRIIEEQGSSYLMELFFLHQLARIEVYSFQPGEDVSPSLAILEDKALSQDLPGILGQVLLLKAEIALLNNDEALLREIIPQLQTLSDKENLHFLKPQFEILLRKL